MQDFPNSFKNKTAVALGYDEAVDLAPKLLLSGHGVIAQQIVDIAKESNIPLHKDADLVQLLSVLNIDEYIPLELYSIIAEIIFYIHKQDNKHTK